MYTVIGIKPDGEQSEPLRYPTLAEAMQKLKDLIEADELDVEGGQDAMFVQYIFLPDPKVLPPPPDEEDKPQMPTHIPPPAQQPSLRLVRDEDE